MKYCDVDAFHSVVCESENNNHSHSYSRNEGKSNFHIRVTCANLRLNFFVNESAWITSEKTETQATI